MSGGSVLRPAALRVPGSTSNLGGGFDCLGLAVDRWLEASFEPGGDGVAAAGTPVAGQAGLRLRRRGTLAGLADPAEDDLLVRAFVAALGEAPLGTLSVTSEIPVGKGLGSSAAALVAGAALADAVRGRSVDPEAAFRAAWREEGHGDNAAPSAHGGLVAVVEGSDGPRTLRLELSRGVGLGYVAPSRPLATREARARLPDRVDHAVAVRAVSRAVALVRGLAAADPGLLQTGLADELHVPYRIDLVAGAREAVEAAVAAGAWGATLSGAGSGLLVLGPPGAVEAAVEAAAGVLRRAASPGEDGSGDGGVIGWTLRPAERGVHAVEAGDGPGRSKRP